jgi:cytochrome o ubiquinol oxidase subunit 2
MIVRQALAYPAQQLALVLGAALLCGGCDLSLGPILDPKGPVTLAERDLLFRAVAIMMIVVIPAFIMAGLFMWRYRASNRKARYTPDLAYYWPVEILIWGVPTAIIVMLGFHLWHATYTLDPYRAIDPGIEPLKVEVVAQDWKWLFIYPDQDIAVVNELVFPSGTPLSLKITSDTVMNSFVIPALGGQIFAMAGMETRLHLLADEPGKFWGRNVQYSGRGFANQQFRAIATTKEEFDAWVEKVKGASETLDASTYEKLLKPSQKVPVTYYSGFEPNLFDTIIAKYSSNQARAIEAAGE